MNSTFWKYVGTLVLIVVLSACGGPSPTPAGDTTPPVISIVGANPLTIQAGDTYVEQGATAVDNVDGDITSSIVVSGTVNTLVPGVYSVNYNVSDKAGNHATQKTRTVIVVDTVGPVITPNGSTPVTVIVGHAYVDPGATAHDNVDGDVTSSILISGVVDTSVVGTYVITYSVSDKSGNLSSVTRTVHVIAAPDTTPPMITLVGVNPQTIQVGGAYVDPGVTAVDNVDGNITSSVVASGVVNTMVPGTYFRYYNVSDSSGNAATQVSRTVVVEPVPVATSGKTFYYGFDAAQKLANGGDGAVYADELSTGITTRLWGGYQCLASGCGVMFPETIVPSRDGSVVAMQGGNLDGIHVLNLSTLKDAQVVFGQIDWAPTCASWSEGSFDITADGSMTVFSSRCLPTGLPEYRDIVLMKLDGSMGWMRVTNDADYDTSPVIGGVDAATGNVSVYFLSNKAGSTGIYKQVVNPTSGLVGGQVLVVSNVIDGVRAMSFNADFSKFAFMRNVNGAAHIFVKDIATGGETDLVEGGDPYWGTNTRIMYSYGGSPSRFAILPDGTGKVQVPTPSNVFPGSVSRIVFAQ